MKRTYFFTADWCESCPPVKLRWLEAIRKYPDIEQHTIDMTTDEGKDWQKRLGFRGIPVIALVNADDTVHEMWTNPGTMSVTDFETKLFHWR